MTQRGRALVHVNREQSEYEYTTWIFTDIRGSYQEPGGETPRRQTSEVDPRHRHLESLESEVKRAGATSTWIGEDNLCATFAHLGSAIDAAKAIARRGGKKEDGFSDRVGVHISPGGGACGGEYSKGAAMAKRIMDICPPGFVICSDQVLDNLGPAQRSRLRARGPFAVKLKGPTRPALVYAVPSGAGPTARPEIASWQTAAATAKREYDALGRLRQPGEESEYAAARRTLGVWRGCRDQGFYVLGGLAFLALYLFGRCRGDERLQVQAARGLGDVQMLRKRKKAALKWAKRAARLARFSESPFDRAFYLYQTGHILTSCGNAKIAEKTLRIACARFERLEDPRMAGWAMRGLGRCLRLQGKNREAESWILASIVVFASARKERAVAYSLSQMVRLRAAQSSLAAARWYLEQGVALYPVAFSRAPDEAMGEPTLKSLRKRLEMAGVSEGGEVGDAARGIVEAALANAFPHLSRGYGRAERMPWAKNRGGHSG